MHIIIIYQKIVYKSTKLHKYLKYLYVRTTVIIHLINIVIYFSTYIKNLKNIFCIKTYYTFFCSFVELYKPFSICSLKTIELKRSH